MRTYPLKDFKYGLVNSIEEQSIKAGGFSDMKN